MSNNFPIHYGEAIVGNIRFLEEGLYWNYEGNCKLIEDGIYRIYGSYPQRNLNLGVCRPMAGLWHIRGKIPRNNIDLTNIHFSVNSADKDVRFEALDANNHFNYLQQLNTCRFAFRNGVPGLLIHEMNQPL